MSMDDIENRLGKVEDGLGEVKQEIASIKLQVTNHLPHSIHEVSEQIADVHKTIKDLDARIAPIETVKTKVVGASEFVSIVMKSVIALTAVIWTVIQILNYLSAHNLWIH